MECNLLYSKSPDLNANLIQETPLREASRIMFDRLGTAAQPSWHVRLTVTFPILLLYFTYICGNYCSEEKFTLRRFNMSSTSSVSLTKRSNLNRTSQQHGMDLWRFSRLLPVPRNTLSILVTSDPSLCHCARGRQRTSPNSTPTCTGCACVHLQHGAPSPGLGPLWNIATGVPRNATISWGLFQGLFNRGISETLHLAPHLPLHCISWVHGRDYCADRIPLNPKMGMPRVPVDLNEAYTQWIHLIIFTFSDVRKIKHKTAYISSAFPDDWLHFWKIHSMSKWSKLTLLKK